MSIKTKLNLILLIVGIIAFILIDVLNNIDARKRIFEEAYQKAELINSFAMAARKYTVKTMRPLAIKIAGKGQFHPEIMGGFFVARSISDSFARSQPGYSFKQATVDPVNSSNKADAQEIKVINAFNLNPDLPLQKGIITRDNAQYFYLARPVVAKKSCLLCHGSPDFAPRGRKERYPGPGGYNYKENSVIATFITYVSLEEALSKLKYIAFKNAILGTIIVLFILVILWVVLDRIVTKPIRNLTSVAEEISRGKGLNQKLEVSAKDEIGDLYKSFDRMRKSVVKLMKMVRK
jgi:HAMP domain-containing protein